MGTLVCGGERTVARAAGGRSPRVRTGSSFRFTTPPRRLGLFGELDHRCAPLMTEVVADLRGHGDLELDLTSLSSISPVGLDVLVDLYDTQRAAGDELTVIGASRRIRRAFALGNCSWLLGPSPGAVREGPPGRLVCQGARVGRADRPLGVSRGSRGDER